MRTLHFLCGRLIRVVPVLVCILTVGCQHQQPSPIPLGKNSVCKGDPSDCVNPHHNLKVDTSNGVDQQEICVCRGESVKWDENGSDNRKHNFQVEFNKGNGSPFSETVFHNGHDQGTVLLSAPYGQYNYKITVDGTPHDPRIVVGGGH